MKWTCTGLLSLVMLVATLGSTCPESLSAEEACPADAFVDFIGVNTHLG